VEREEGRVVELFRSNINTGRPWGSWDTNDLLHAIEVGEPVWSISESLCRTPYEIRMRAREMGCAHRLIEY
jgi:hypothetical protein